VRYCIQSADAVLEREEDGVEKHVFFGTARECAEFEQRVLWFAERSNDRRDDRRDDRWDDRHDNGKHGHKH